MELTGVSGIGNEYKYKNASVILFFATIGIPTPVLDIINVSTPAKSLL